MARNTRCPCGLDQGTDPTGWAYLETPAPSVRCPKCWRRIRKACHELYAACVTWSLTGNTRPLLAALEVAEGKAAARG